MIESAYEVKLRPLSIVIFSKDRAAQLDLCLKSIQKNLSNLSEHWNIYIIHTSSSKEFEDGYNQLIKEYYSKPNPIFFFPEHKYNGFKKTLEYCMKHWEDYVLFFTDDDIAYRKLEYKYEEIVREELFCTSLRLGSNTFVQDQYINSHCFIPDEVNTSKEKLKRWVWKNQGKDTNFGYPFGVDGHIFSCELAKQIINNTPNYDNPNSLEGKAQHYIEQNISIMPDEMACLEKSCVVGIPVNRVQETCTNKAGFFFNNPPEKLNEEFLKGKRLSLEKMDFDTIIGCHQEIKLIWT